MKRTLKTLLFLGLAGLARAAEWKDYVPVVVHGLTTIGFANCHYRTTDDGFVFVSCQIFGVADGNPIWISLPFAPIDIYQVLSGAGRINQEKWPGTALSVALACSKLTPNNTCPADAVGYATVTKYDGTDVPYAIEIDFRFSGVYVIAEAPQAVPQAVLPHTRPRPRPMFKEERDESRR